jgi:hypothetical protein
MSLSPRQKENNKITFINTLELSEDQVPTSFYDYLERSDFYSAPASSKYHENYEGGLVEHSLKVYEHLATLNYNKLLRFSESTVAKVALLHDVCKINFYKKGMKNKRLEDGTWVRTEQYEINDSLPIGHGEKSVIVLLQHGVKLNEEEILAIRWHMGGYSASAKDYIGGQALAEAMASNQLVVALQIADLMSVWL